jgi:hypothetical protein
LFTEFQEKEDQSGQWKSVVLSLSVKNLNFVAEGRSLNVKNLQNFMEGRDALAILDYLKGLAMQWDLVDVANNYFNRYISLSCPYNSARVLVSQGYRMGLVWMYLQRNCLQRYTQ